RIHAAGRTRRAAPALEFGQPTSTGGATMYYDDDDLIEGFKQHDEGGPGRVTVAGEPLKHVVHHSPDGFQWGYGGSGPADLALSILSAVIGPETERVEIWSGTCGARAWRLHHAFKSNV